ncbi:MAG: SxtJ family membrane protein [Candidatus Omnitrophota bacterium]
MEKGKVDKAALKKFGITMAIAFLAIAILILFRHKHNPKILFIISAIFLAFGVLAPLLLKPFFVFWMRLALILGWLNTRLILMLMFYLVFTPIGLVLRLFRVDLLERKLNNKKISYWHKKEQAVFNPQEYERQF